MKLSVLPLFFLAFPAIAQTYESEKAKAEAAYSKNSFDSCTYYFKRAFLLEEPKGADLYNAAICHSLSGRRSDAFRLLFDAIKEDINLLKLKVDPDLEPLHTDRRWRRLLKKADREAKKLYRNLPYPEEARMLADLWVKDQYWRFRLGKAYKQSDTATINDIWKKLKPVDSVNLQIFLGVVDRIGWPTRSGVGKLGAATAFLIVDHAPREIMEKYLPLIEEAAKKGEASVSNYATLKDRVLVNRGKKQLYGTQKYWDESKKEFVFFPIEDEENVNNRRKEVGLKALPGFNE